MRAQVTQKGFRIWRHPVIDVHLPIDFLHDLTGTRHIDDLIDRLDEEYVFVSVWPFVCMV